VPTKYLHGSTPQIHKASCLPPGSSHPSFLTHQSVLICDSADEGKQGCIEYNVSLLLSLGGAGFGLNTTTCCCLDTLWPLKKTKGSSTLMVDACLTECRSIVEATGTGPHGPACRPSSLPPAALGQSTGLGVWYSTSWVSCGGLGHGYSTDCCHS